MKVSLEPNNHVVIHLCRERFINIILSKFKITKPEFISIFNDWFLKKYSKKIMTEGINLPTNNTKIVGDYPNGHWEKYQYDDNGNLIKFENAQNDWKKYEYNDRGKLIFLEDSNGYWEKIIYSEDGKKAKYNNSKGEWWEQQYDEKGRLVKYIKSDGYWEKRRFNDAGDLIYYETSFGKVRDQIQEGLMLPYKEKNNKFSDGWRNVEVSHGTMDIYDLVPIFFRLLKSQTWNTKIQDKITLLINEWKEIQKNIVQHGRVTDEDSEAVGWFMQDLFDFINELAPDGTSFGSSEGDGSSYGFWSFYNETCPECGNEEIRNINYGEGTAYCPNCQKTFEMDTYYF